MKRCRSYSIHIEYASPSEPELALVLRELYGQYRATNFCEGCRFATREYLGLLLTFDSLTQFYQYLTNLLKKYIQRSQR